MNNKQNTYIKKMWEKIYKLRRINALLAIYSIITTVMLIVLFSTNAKAEENLLKYNVLPVKLEVLEHYGNNSNLEVSNNENKTTTMTITAYCPCRKCCGKTDGITASNVKAVEGVTVAMDKSIPFGTKVYIDGVGERIVQDRGGSIKGNKLDLFFNDHQSALNFGRQTKQVTILN